MAHLLFAALGLDAAPGSSLESPCKSIKRDDWMFLLGLDVLPLIWFSGLGFVALLKLYSSLSS